MERTPQHRSRYTNPAPTTRGRDYSGGYRAAPDGSSGNQALPQSQPAPQPSETQVHAPTQIEPSAANSTARAAHHNSLPDRTYMQLPTPAQQLTPHHRVVAAPAAPPPFNPPQADSNPAAPHFMPPTQPVNHEQHTAEPHHTSANATSPYHYVGPPHHDYQRYIPDAEPTQQEFETIDFEPPEVKRSIHFIKIRNKVNNTVAGFKTYYSASPRRAGLVAVSSVLVLSAIAWTFALQNQSANELLAKTPFSFLLIKQGNTQDIEVLIDEEQPTPDEISKHTAPSKHPRYISIPKFNMFSRVLSLESKDEGIELPYNIYDVGWSTQSDTPETMTGTQLYIGHAKGLTKADAAFSRLTELKVGDEITVETGDGAAYTYIVQYTEKANVSSPNISRYYDSWVQGKPGLNLLTTSGVDPSKENPSQNRYATFAVFSILKE